jgi:hypothetical protein
MTPGVPVNPPGVVISKPGKRQQTFCPLEVSV